MNCSLARPRVWSGLAFRAMVDTIEESTMGGLFSNWMRLGNLRRSSQTNGGMS
jgi:hypothetical protein